MGYAGKVEERERARELRAQSWTLQEIADELGVSKGSVSVWVRDVDFVPRPRNRGHSGHKPHPLTLKKQAQLEQCRQEAIERVGNLNARDRLMFGLALYLGEGFKTEEASMGMANTDPAILRFFVGWMREFFEIDESRFRVRLYLHDDLDVDAATSFWSAQLQIPYSQFTRPYRAQQRGSYRRSKHVYGCPQVRYSDLFLHRRVMAMIAAISSQVTNPG
jgi:hypothetical protein